MRRGNKAMLRLIKDPDSSTGMSAAILIKNVRPVKLGRAGAYRLARCDFTSGFSLNCDGIKIKPRTVIEITCVPTKAQSDAAARVRRIERAFAGAPMLK